MDFDLPAGLDRLAEEAAAVASEWSARAAFPDDSWIVGHDAAFARGARRARLARHDLAGRRRRRTGAPPLERFVVFEALIAGGRAARRAVVRRPPDRPDAAAVRHTGPAPALAARHPRRHLDVVHRHERARRRLATSRRCARRARPRRRRLDRQRRRRSGPAAPRSPTGATSSPAPTPTRRRTPGCPSSSSTCTRPGIEVRPIVDMTGNDHFCEVHLRRRARAGRPPRRRAQRQLPPGDAPDGARARRHRPARVEPRCCTDDPCGGALDRPSRPARAPGVAALETGYRIGRLLVLREVLGQAPAAVLRRDEDVLHRVRAARRRLLRATCSGPQATLCDAGGRLGESRPRRLLRAGVHDHGRHHADPAQHPRRTDARTAALNRGEHRWAGAVRRSTRSGVRPSGNEPECTITSDFVVRVIVT